jgi:hypothetical protein
MREPGTSGGPFGRTASRDRIWLGIHSAHFVGAADFNGDGKDDLAGDHVVLPSRGEDIIAAKFALLSLLLLSSAAGVAVAWIFSLWGSADLFNAFFQANRAGLLAGQLGAAYFLPTLVVPLLPVTHGITFRIFLLPRKGLAMREGRYAASDPSAIARFGGVDNHVS